MALRHTRGDLSDELSFRLTRADNTLGGFLLLTAIVLILAGGAAARVVEEPGLSMLLPLAGFCMVVLRTFLVRERKRTIMESFGLGCPTCDKTPVSDLIAGQALRTGICPHCRSSYHG